MERGLSSLEPTIFESANEAVIIANQGKLWKAMESYQNRRTPRKAISTRHPVFSNVAPVVLTL